MTPVKTSDALRDQSRWLRDYTTEAHPADRAQMIACSLRIDELADAVVEMEEALRPRTRRELRRRRWRETLLRWLRPVPRLSIALPTRRGPISYPVRGLK
jgi:hypothetical protein